MGVNKPGQINSRIPEDPRFKLTTIIDQLRQEISAARTGRSLQAAAIGQGGIQVQDAGTITMLGGGGMNVLDGGFVGVTTADDSQYLFYAGTFDTGGHNLPQDQIQAVLAVRPGGAVALAFEDPGGGETWTFQLLDAAQNTVFADDVGGIGIGWPPQVWPSPVSNSAPTDATTSSTFEALEAASGYWTTPNILGTILVRSSDAATTGEVRITAGGVQVGDVIPVAGNDFAFVNYGPWPLPGEYGANVILAFEARRTAGTGTIGIRAGTPIGGGS